MDHEQEARQRRIEMYRAMTPAQKYRRIMQLRALAREVKRAGVHNMRPDRADAQVKAEVREIFLYART